MKESQPLPWKNLPAEPTLSSPHMRGSRLGVANCGLLGGSVVKNPPAKQEIQFWSLGQEDPLEKEMATHSSILGWEIPWTEKPGGVAEESDMAEWLNTCGPLPLFISKIVLKQPHPLLYMLSGCFYVTAAELSGCDRAQVAHKLKILTLWPLNRELAKPRSKQTVGKRTDFECHTVLYPLCHSLAVVPQSSVTPQFPA